MRHIRNVMPSAAIIVLLLATARVATACPFCSAVSLTFAQEIAQSQAAVIARVVEPPPVAALQPRPEGPLPKATLEVVKALKGSELVAAGTPVETVMLDAKPAGTLCLMFGVEPPNLIWSSPIPVSDRAVEYLGKLADLPEKGPDRLAFFQDHLEDADDTLARDAYDEFAVAPYADVKALKDRMRPDQLLAWVEDPKVQANRRRLYATMLGVCGSPADASRIERLLVGEDLGPDEAEARSGVDALIACYVALRGADALDLVDRLFLQRAGRDVPFAETYAAVMALRFLGEESDLVPRERVLESLRLLLAEPKLADLVIADLARWQDWSVVERLVQLFKEASQETIFVREPVVNYLRACPLPEAAAAVKELEAIDPEAVRRAATLAGLAGVVAGGGAGQVRPAASDGADGGAASAAPVAATADVSALVARITPVLGDEEATDDVPGAVPEPARSPAGPKPSSAAPAWKWAVWAAVVMAVAAAVRAVLKPGRAGAA
ncbi:MAG: hypothetical protein ACKON7_11245 [Planctomycetaceae bacterium]